MYLYSNIIGTFVFNQNFQVREKHLFTEHEAVKNHPLLVEGKELDSEKIFLERFKGMTNLREDKAEFVKHQDKVESMLRDMIPEFYKLNVIVTKHSVRDSITDDLLIVQSISSLMETQKQINMVAKRLREWYSFMAPEISERLTDHKIFAEKVVQDKPSVLLKEANIKESMGKDPSKDDLEAVQSQARLLLELIKVKEDKEKHLEKHMKKTCPNLTAVAGYLTGAKLLSLAGSLREMVLMPASTIQLLGAEKALFRHMLNKNAKSPKHGIIIEHPLIQAVSKLEKGKASRALADKIGLAVKIDYFKGVFIGDSLRKQLEERFNV